MRRRSHPRRSSTRSLWRRKLFCVLVCPLLIFIFAGCSDNWFRLKPKKGRPHPHPPEEERFNRTWLYKHTEEIQSMFSEDERIYREERARQLVLEKKFYATSVERFGLALKKIRILNLQLADSIFSKLLFSWFLRAVDFKGYSVSTSKIVDSKPSNSESSLSGCFSPDGLQVKITSHLHYGDDPNDTDTYYEVYNGFFPISQDNNVCRIFLLDIVRFGRKSNGVVADTDKIISFFSSEDISTEKAWYADKDYPDDVSVMQPDLSELENSDIDYPDVLKALFNFMQMNIHNPLGIRFQEILVSKDSANSGVTYSPTHIMTLVKDDVDKRLEQRGSEH